MSNVPEATAGLVSRLAWQSVRKAFAEMPALFIGVTVINVCLGLTIGWVLNRHDPGSGIIHGLRVAAVGGLIVVAYLASTIVLAAFAVGVHRLVLLQEVSPLRMALTRRVGVFSLWCAAIGTLSGAAIAPIAFTGVFILTATAMFAIAFVTIRLLFVFPAVAVDVTCQTISERLRVSWEMTRGLFWKLFFALLLSFLPIILVRLVVLLITSFLAIFAFGDLAELTSPWMYDAERVNDVLSNLLEPLEVALAAAVASWMYLWALEHPYEPPTPPQSGAA
jgi:hypothetical protein